MKKNNKNLIKFGQIIFSLPTSSKILIAIVFDLLSCFISVWLSYFLRLGEFVPFFREEFLASLISIIIAIPIFIVFGLYKAVFRYSGSSALLLVFQAILAYGIIYGMVLTIYGVQGVPRTIGLIQPLVLFSFLASWRMTLSFWLGGLYRRKFNSFKNPKALIYGAGSAGRQLVKAIRDSGSIDIKGFIDDDLSTQGRLIDGKQVYSPNKLRKLIDNKGINLVLLALPSVPRKRRIEIIKNLSYFNIAIRTIPGISSIALGYEKIDHIEDLDIDDLIGREQIEPFNHLMTQNISTKVILVTGSGGSIGSELCRQILKLKPKKLLMVEINEFALYKIHSELSELQSKRDELKSIEIIPLIASVKNSQRMDEIMKTWRPSTIYHAAAYKHVPLVEHNVIEGLDNNIFGTLTIAELALKHKVLNFVLISTDKAVRPTNIMGASKRISELCLQALFGELLKHNKDKQKTNISIVRFGNVIDSSGSVIPKFREQIRNGGPLTITHKDIKRFFMTISEAAELVIQAGAMATGGDVFVLDMGEPVKIITLAIRMIELSGLTVKNNTNPNGDIAIKMIGLRPGEKLYEELLISNNPQATKHPKIFKSSDPYIEWGRLKPKIDTLQKLLSKSDLEAIRNLLKDIVNDFHPKNEIVDYVYKAKAK